MSPHHSPDTGGAGSDAVLAGITELLPVFRQRAQEAEDGRVVPAESVKSLAETGFFRLLQPAAQAAWRRTRSRSSPRSG